MNAYSGCSRAYKKNQTKRQTKIFKERKNRKGKTNHFIYLGPQVSPEAKWQGVLHKAQVT